jgi:pheromone shutdown protein TraB
VSMKKRLCNPPAELVAGVGDPEVTGMFQGAGDGATHLEGLIRKAQADSDAKGQKKLEAALEKFVKATVLCEGTYVQERKALAARTVAEMKEIFEKVVAVVGE